jgi:hypothetical protein
MLSVLTMQVVGSLVFLESTLIGLEKIQLFFSAYWFTL